MPGPAPKPSGLRQRRNKATTATTLPMDPGVTAPPPPPGLGKRATEWWIRAWASPMAREWLSSDIPGLELVAELWDGLYKSDTPSLKVKLAGEIRLQEARFGLSPMDRRRLQYEIERGDEADSRTRKRRRSQQDEPAQDEMDPRDALGS